MPAKPKGCGGKNPEITVCQVRTAANALIDARTLPARHRNERLDRVSRKLIRDQRKNAQGRRSHTKTRRTLLNKLQINLAAYDGADGTCGNQLLACGLPTGCAAGTAPAAGRYKALGDAFADDRLYLDTSKTTCGTLYLGVEANAIGVTNHDCGGRTPTNSEDAVDETYTFATVGAAGFSGGKFAVTDGVSNAEAPASLTTFPFLADPN